MGDCKIPILNLEFCALESWNLQKKIQILVLTAKNWKKKKFSLIKKIFNTNFNCNKSQEYYLRNITCDGFTSLIISLLSFYRF